MSSIIVLTLIGRDRPGLVKRIASLVAENHGEWLESRMAHLGGQFAGILKVRVPEDSQAALQNALEGLQTEEISVTLRSEPSDAAPVRNPATIELLGQDKPGIVRQISQLLAAEGVNVEEIHTEIQSAPMTGEPLFRAKLRVGLPEEGGHEPLQVALEKIAADLMVEITVEPGEKPTG